jgi:hypothetical protein
MKLQVHLNTVEARDSTQQKALANPGWAPDKQYVAFVDGEIDICQDYFVTQITFQSADL